MRFDSAHDVETACWSMKWNDRLLSRYRALVNDLFDGFPPYTDEEVQANQIEVNVNDLAAARIAHDALRQYQNAFLAPEQFFTVNLDYGPAWKKREWANTITREVNKPMKDSRAYRQTQSDVFKQVIGHGIGPTAWHHKELWCPAMIGIEDVLLPSRSLVSLDNLNYFALFTQFTYDQLYKLTHGPRVDPGWQMELVKDALAWVERQKGRTPSETEANSPEKSGQLAKAQRSMFCDDATPTIDCWMFFHFDADDRRSGWNRKIILDTPTSLGSGRHDAPGDSTKSFMDTRGKFLYDSGRRKYADKLSQIIHFQFGNTSCVAPSYYHTIRALGWLLYSVCHLQNRLSSKLDESAFESLMQYFWANGERDLQRIQQINLTHKKVLPEGLRFVRPEERWKVDLALPEFSIGKNRDILNQTASSFRQELDLGEKQAAETATRTTARVNASAAIVGSMLNDAYGQARFQYQEIARRFCVRNSRDPDVRKFRVRCIKAGVPEAALNADLWDVQPVKVIGSGNMTLQMAMVDKLMALFYDKLDPQGQRELTRLGIAVNSQDYSLASRWVPEQREVTDSIKNAQRDAATLLLGLPVSLSEGVNHEEVAQTYLIDMGLVVKRIEASGGMADVKELMGLMNLAGVNVQGQPVPDGSVQWSNVRTHIALFAQHDSPETKAKVKTLGDALGQLMNLIKGFAQRLAEQKSDGNGQAQPGMAPEDMVKIKGMVAERRAKIQVGAESHAAKTAQRQVSFDAKLAQDAQKHQVELAEQQIAAQTAKPKTENP